MIAVVVAVVAVAAAVVVAAVAVVVAVAEGGFQRIFRVAVSDCNSSNY